MGPTDQQFSDEQAGQPAATDAERERMAAAERAGWTIRRDPMRAEFTAARELHTARTLAALLDAIEGDGGGR